VPNKPKKKPRPLKVEITATEATREDIQDRMGMPVRAVSQEEAEQSSLVVCVYAGMEEDRFKVDNIYTTCADCMRPITHRPHAPKNPPKVCMPCAVIRMQNEAEESCDEA